MTGQWILDSIICIDELQLSPGWSALVYIQWNHANSYWLVHCSVSTICIGNHMIHSTGRSFSISSHIAHSLAMHATGIYSVTCLTQWHNYKFYPPPPKATTGFTAPQCKLRECPQTMLLAWSIKMLSPSTWLNSPPLTNWQQPTSYATGLKTRV